MCNEKGNECYMMIAHLVELLMAPLLTSVSSLSPLLHAVMRPMLKAEPLIAQ
jgi:hypothetical protein